MNDLESELTVALLDVLYGSDICAVDCRRKWWLTNTMKLDQRALQFCNTVKDSSNELAYNESPPVKN